MTEKELGGIELEQHILGIKREIYGEIKERNPEKIKELIDNVTNILKGEKERGRDFLFGVEKASDIENGPHGGEYFVDGDIAYLPRQGEGIFIGDIHGDPEAIISIVEQSGFIENMEGGDREKTLVFTGDYVDRGSDSVGALGLVLKLKEKYPNNVILLRGNHEDKGQIMKENYENEKNLYKSIGEEVYPGDNFEAAIDGMELLHQYDKLFEELPGVLFTANGIMAVHGGIPSEDVNDLHDLNNEEKMRQMRWNDPGFDSEHKTPNLVRDKKEKFKFIRFGLGDFREFMNRVGANIMIRSHEVVTYSSKTMFGDRLVTIFSTGGNKSKLAHDAYKRKVKIPGIAVTDLEKDKEYWDDDDFREIEYVGFDL